MIYSNMGIGLFLYPYYFFNYLLTSINYKNLHISRFILTFVLSKGDNLLIGKSKILKYNLLQIFFKNVKIT